MLGLEIPRMDFFTEVGEASRRKKPQARSYIYGIAEKHNMKIVGYGAEKYVVELPNDPSKIASADFSPKTPELVKAIYYTHRIYSKLWPYNFPKPCATAGSIDKTMPSMTIKDRIFKDKFNLNNLLERRLVTFHKGVHIFQVKYPFSEVERDCRKFDIPLVIDDSIKANFIVGRDGGEYYIDTIHNYNADIDLPVDNFIDYMESRNIAKSEQNKIVTEIQRSNYLFEVYSSGRSEQKNS